MKAEMQQRNLHGSRGYAKRPPLDGACASPHHEGATGHQECKGVYFVNPGWLLSRVKRAPGPEPGMSPC